MWKADESEAESIVLLVFLLWRCFNLWWVRGGVVGQKVLFKASWNRIFFQVGFLAEAISMTHCSILYRLDVFTFYFYEPLPFQILVPRKFILIYSMKSVFFIKIHFNLFYIQIWFKCEVPLLIFWIKTMIVCYYHVTYEFQSESRPYSLPECQGTPCPKQAPYLKFKWSLSEVFAVT